MDEGISDASTGDRPGKPSNARPKQNRQQPIRLENKIVRGKKSTKDGKNSKDELGEKRRDHWLKAIRALTNTVNGQNRMIKEQNVKFQELAAKLGE